MKANETKEKRMEKGTLPLYNREERRKVRKVHHLIIEKRCRENGWRFTEEMFRLYWANFEKRKFAKQTPYKRTETEII